MIYAYFDLREKIPITGENYVTFIEQYVTGVCGFSSQYGNNNSISYTVYNIIGRPNIYPAYGDFPQAYVMRTYGQWWDKAPSRSVNYMPQNEPDVISHDYIDLEYYSAVYPIRISIYEIYNPGSVVRIWAQNSDRKWFLLWSGPPQIVCPQSRIFSPPLQPCNFKTNMIRLEFNHSHLDYYTKLDAVLLIGTCELILPKDQSLNLSLSRLLQTMNTAYPDQEDIHNLTPNYTDINMDLYRLKESLETHCVIYKNEIVERCHKIKLLSADVMQLYHDIPPFNQGQNNMQEFLQRDFPNFVRNITLNEPQSSYNRFLVLPNDSVIQEILKHLDLKSLYNMCCVDQYFKYIATDSLLYKYINLRPYWYCFNANALTSLMSRCEYLQKLDLSWCGNHGMLTPADLKVFINQCGKKLTHLRLNCCEIVNDSIIYLISWTCKNLKELCLRNCQHISSTGFGHLYKFQNLEILDLYRTFIETATICKILRRNPRMRHLSIAGIEYLNVDEIAKELANSCPDLESVDFWKTSNFTSVGINALARCKNLREIDLGWCGTTFNHSESFCKLLTCKHLEKIFLASFRKLPDHDFRQITLCRELKQLDLLGAMCLTPDTCRGILLFCPKLQMIDLSFCNLISNSMIDEWRREFPDVSIKRSCTRRQI